MQRRRAAGKSSAAAWTAASWRPEELVGWLGKLLVRSPLRRSPLPAQMLPGRWMDAGWTPRGRLLRCGARLSCGSSGTKDVLGTDDNAAQLSRMFDSVLSVVCRVPVALVRGRSAVGSRGAGSMCSQALVQ